MPSLNVLGELEILGQEAAQRANPHYWSAGQKRWPQEAQRDLERLRFAFRYIRAGEDPVVILKHLDTVIKGPGRVRINLMIQTLTGQLKKPWFINDQGMLEFKEKDYSKFMEKDFDLRLTSRP